MQTLWNPFCFCTGCKIDLFYEHLRYFQFSKLLDIGEGERSCHFLLVVGPSFSGFWPFLLSWGLALPTAGWPFLLWGFGGSFSEVGLLKARPFPQASGLALPSGFWPFLVGFLGGLALPSGGLPRGWPFSLGFAPLLLWGWPFLLRVWPFLLGVWLFLVPVGPLLGGFGPCFFLGGLAIPSFSGLAFFSRVWPFLLGVLALPSRIFF